MEDPWGSPWAAGESLPTIDLSPAPPTTIATTTTTTTKTKTKNAPSESNSFGGDSTLQSSSLWEDDNEWGGWSDEPPAPLQGNSPGWGRSPALQPVDDDAVVPPRKISSDDPWGKLGALSIHDMKEDARGKGHGESNGDDAHEEATPKNADSAVSFGGIDFERDGNATSTYFPAPRDVWLDEEPTTVRSKPAAPEADTPGERPESPVPTTGESASPILQDEDSVLSSDEAPEESSVSSDGRAPVEEPEHVNVKTMAEAGTEAVEDTPRSPTAAIPVSADLEALDEEPDSAEAVIITTEDKAEKEDSLDSTSATSAKDTPEKLPPISITVDLSALDKLFPSVKQLPKPDPEPIPDVIIDDTFASMPERKAWYRLSRRGPMRMHDMGGDLDSFVRMDWRGSNVRHDTLVIVRRWMEEDSIAGRVVLGRGGGAETGSKLFNWDSSAPQVEIGDLLGKRKKEKKMAGHSRQASRTSMGSPISPATAAFAWSSPPTSPVAHFQPSSATTTTTKPPEFVTTRPESVIIPPPPPIGRPVSIDQALKRPVAPPITPLGAPQDPTEDEDEDDDDEDDDWGEMVASPGHDQRVSLDMPPSVSGRGSNTNGLPSPISTTSGDKSPLNGLNGPPRGQDGAVSGGFGNLDSFLGGPHSSSQKSIPMSAQRALSHKRSQSDMVSSSSSSVLTAKTGGIAKPSPLKVAVHSKADDEMVAGILADLPDLSYMLKR